MRDAARVQSLEAEYDVSLSAVCNWMQPPRRLTPRHSEDASSEHSGPEEGSSVASFESDAAQDMVLLRAGEPHDASQCAGDIWACALTSRCPSISRDLAQYQDFYKVVYVTHMPDRDVFSSVRRQALTIASTVAILTLQARVGRTNVYRNVEGGARPSKKRHKPLFALRDLHQAAQFVLDEALVTSAVFVHSRERDASDTARQYERGTAKLVPQFCVHNNDVLPVTYEVGCVMREPNAGLPGKNGCLQGLHVHRTLDAALEHAKLMSCQPETEANAGALYRPALVSVFESPLRFVWKQWNGRPTPWCDADADAVACLACGLSIGATSKKYRFMDCGHGFMCGTCAGIAREDMVCPECALRATRISGFQW